LHFTIYSLYENTNWRSRFFALVLKVSRVYSDRIRHSTLGPTVSTPFPGQRLTHQMNTVAALGAQQERGGKGEAANDAFRLAEVHSTRGIGCFHIRDHVKGLHKVRSVRSVQKNRPEFGDQVLKVKQVTTKNRDHVLADIDAVPRTK
jgi:hypothetical protein